MRVFYHTLLALFIASQLMFVSMADAGAEFIKVTGIVDVFSAGEKVAKKIGVGTVVQPGDIVRTAKRSRARLKFSDGSTLNIGSLSKIKIGEFSYSETTHVRKTHISNLRGQLVASVSQSNNINSYFRVQTPGAVASVRGTVLGIDVNGKSSKLITYKGSVEFTNAHGSYMVNAGQESIAHFGKPPSLPRNLSRMELVKAAGATKMNDDSDSDSDESDSNSGDGDSGGDAAVSPEVPKVETPPITTTLPGLQKQKLNLTFQL